MYKTIIIIITNIVPKTPPTIAPTGADPPSDLTGEKVVLFN